MDNMCTKCWFKLKDYHETKTKRLLDHYNYFIAFNTTSSRWGATSVLSTIFSFFIAFATALFALVLSIYGVNGNNMTPFAWFIAILALMFGLIGIVGMVFMGWIILYWLRFPLTEDSPILKSINKAVSEDIPQKLETINTSIQGIGKKMKKQNDKGSTKTKKDSQM